ncbi:MAG: protein kinase [Gemmatimonadales bacterium]|nr:protein kinase [Gemmatimonadales bacterium]
MSDAKDRLAEALSDRYTLGNEIGVGGMATVYMAEDIKHGRTVALKVLKPELSSAMGTDRFPREIRLIASFNHPHILSLYDSGESAGFLYYVMPFVEGETLGARLAREKELPIGDVIRILIEVTDALAYAHDRGVVHRDIKPGNVLLANRHAVVADFGVAKALSAAGGDQLTTVGIAVGTPQYMAPEQAMGESDIDHRVDIYAVGILAYEMLTGRAPFEAKTSQAMLSAHVMEVPKDPRELRPGIPAPLAEAVLKCLAKHPADRWQKAEDLRAQLETMLATPSGGMTPTDTRPYQATTARTRPRTSRWAIGVAAAVALAAVGGTTWMLAQGGGAIERIGVMPIEDISGQDQLFTAAMHDALTNAMAQLGVGVASRSDMARYAGGGKSTREVATEQNLDAVVETTVFRAGDVMRITVQFSDPVTTRSLWAATYNTNVTDVLSAQGAVVDSIRTGIGATLGATGKSGGME